VKKFINNAARVVDDEIDGMVSLYPDVVRRLAGTRVLVRRDAPILGKVALVSGGGSGHEPLHFGYVGKGVLDAAVMGEVFTSPPPDQIYSAIREVDGRSGVLLVVKNYAGDLMNFKIAEEWASRDGIEIVKVVVRDDVALAPMQIRRGVAGTILVHKIAGAKAESRAQLQQVQELAERVILNVRSMAVALTSCTIPSVGKPVFTLAEDEIEFGTGIHGEPGVSRTRMVTADETGETLLHCILDDMNLKNGDEVVMMTNGMGCTPLMELYIVSRRVLQLLAELGIRVFKSMVGNFVTSLDTAGVSITVLRVDDEMKEMLLAPDTTAGFPKLV